MLVITAILSLLGLPIVGILALNHEWTKTKSVLGKDIWTWPKPFWLWSNDEDGVDPAAVPTAAGAFKWSAMRNKVSNLRFVKPFYLEIDRAKLQGKGNNRNLYLPIPASATGTQWSFAWQGVYAGYWVVWSNGMQFRIGWDVVPADADPVTYDKALNLRLTYCPWTLQFNKWSTT